MNGRRSDQKQLATASKAEPVFTACARIWLAEDGIVHIESRERRQQGLRDAVENVEGVARVAGDLRRPLLVHFHPAAPQTPEARAHYTSETAARACCAVAIVTSSVLGRVVGNLMLGMNGSTLPIKLFDSDAAATKWLMEQWQVKEPPRVSSRGAGRSR